MALFEVPGWSMPPGVKPVANSSSRKRKRGAEDSSSKLQTAEVNVERLMEKLVDVEGGRKRKEKGKEKRGRKTESVKQRNGPDVPEQVAQDGHQDRSTFKHEHGMSDKKRKDGNNTAKETSSLHAHGGPSEPTTRSAAPQQDGHTKSKQKRKKDQARTTGQSSNRQANPSDENPSSPLTHLQAKMKQGLDGAKFRWINETLYKSESQEAERLMHENPALFEEYHIGFRHQVTSWPTNPVNHFIETLSSYPERSVIVDLGCGDAALARNLVPKGYTVLSFDLISANAFIVAADICGRLPLPGSETNDEGQVADVVMCCLSLMNSNWINCIREAARVLKRGGELKIAEVASRFTSVDEFTSAICSVGFRLVSRDGRNSHFTLFDFKKTERSQKLDDKAWEKISACGGILQPCEYKKR